MPVSYYLNIIKYLSNLYGDDDLQADGFGIMFGGDDEKWAYMIRWRDDTYYLNAMHNWYDPIYTCDNEDSMIKFLDIFLVQIL